MQGKREVNIRMDERRAIHRRLSDNRLTSVWMINQLRERGVTTDKYELSSIFAGTRHGPKVDKIIETATQIMDDYESKFVGKG